ncbi:MAG: hypothetical protein ACI935_000051 [Moritella dasanensis]|jgi:hypothetical protein
MAFAKKFEEVLSEKRKLTHNEAYWKLFSLSGNDQDKMLGQMHVYDEQGGEVVGIWNFDFKPDTSGGSYRQQAYEYLLGLDFFSDVKPC